MAAVLRIANNTPNALICGSHSFQPGEVKTTIDFLTPSLADAQRKGLITVTAPNGNGITTYGLAGNSAAAISSYATGYTTLVDSGTVPNNRNFAILAAQIAALQNLVEAQANATHGRNGSITPVALS